MSFFESLPLPFPAATAREQESQLAAAISKGSEDALNELVMRNMREALLYTRRVSQNLDEGSLISICYDALLRNAKRFDPTRQRFFSFAKPGLRGALYRNWNKETEHRPATPPNTSHPLDGKTPAHHNPDEGNANRDMCDLTPVPNGQIIEPDMDSIFTRDRWELVRPVIAQKCSEQERMVLTLTYVSGFNFQEIGDLMGVTRSAIQRTHWRAVKKLRTELGRRKQLFS